MLTTRPSLCDPNAIVLVSCYELGHQPIGIAQPLGFLEQAGFAPTALDIAVENFDADRIKQARFVGISVPMHTALRLGVRAAELIRETNPSCYICFYGLYASINAGYLLEQVADSVIGGEYERPLVSLMEALEYDLETDEIDGVSRRGRIVGPALTRLSRETHPFPVPSRSQLPALDRYARLERDGRDHTVGYVEASRGCLHRCRHCPIVPVYDGRFFVFPQAVVLEDIRQQVIAGATHITFGDPDFFNGPGHSLSIVRAMHAQFPHVTFDFTAKIEHLLKHRSVLPELHTLGCLFVISAVESFSNAVLAHLEKGHTRADILTALDLVRSAGITLRPSLVAFTPWTTFDDYLEMFDLVEAHDLIDAIDPVQYTVRLLIPPGSALLTSDGQPTAAQPFLGPLDQPNFQYHWSHPDARMDGLHRAVTVAVEQDARSGENPVMTFDRLRELAYATAERRPPPPVSNRPRHASRPPRLTEPWFCCAEPTATQFRPLHTKGIGEI